MFLFQFNASWLNEIINYFQKKVKIYRPQTFEWLCIFGKHGKAEWCINTKKTFFVLGLGATPSVSFYSSSSASSNQSPLPVWWDCNRSAHFNITAIFLPKNSKYVIMAGYSSMIPLFLFCKTALIIFSALFTLRLVQ